MNNAYQEEPSKIRLGMYPYMYARVSAMKGKLIKKDDYAKLLKMKTHEVIKYLQETEYKKEIDELAVTHSGIHLMELALQKNLSNAFKKLSRIAEGEMKILINAYVKRKDISNLKVILRGKLTQEKQDYLESLLVPVGELKHAFLLKLLSKENVEEVVKTLPFIDLTEELKLFKDTNSLFAIENALDKYYYTSVIEFTKRIPEQGELFKDFLEYEIDILNITTLLRLKKEGMDAKEISQFLLYSGKHLHKADLKKLLKQQNIQDMIPILKRKGYHKVIEEGEEEFKKSESLAGIERELHHYLLTKARVLYHQHPLSIDVILGYMFAKEIEIKNLTVLLKGKQLELDEEFISQSLVVG
jgi:V/A-type H+/Na+-transporting ATPase subunit C